MESLKRIKKMVQKQLVLAELEINKNSKLYEELGNKDRGLIDDIHMREYLREKVAWERVKYAIENILGGINLEIKSKEHEESEDYKIFQLILEELERDKPIDVQI
ncbi:hypothetical protein ABFP83_18625 [Clostridioides difficile]|uniref:hypothetical protein n=1 Tax=Clostridioides difficile TaxID=1496 RepID=UPI00038CECF4|nr:hypothetical protein [Clostridioides difficile]EGT3734650.1 hypothetical protein [Clostridioides difficile]EGT4112377.1 hypothetical protein [Clostridioides difficile]EGT4518531.1 hypothetical protein [Clostridioides difficile]EGT5022498.1 hypothetical protein [Clostridioides difficile]EII6796177.1 hypothetical protein [Clostridioides difficile]